MTGSVNPLAPFLASQGLVILDGGLATTLERAGHVLDSKLWSAGLLRDAPGAVRDAHMAFLAAGADCIATVSYQASFEGFSKLGLTDSEALELFDLSVQVAVAARDEFWADEANRAGRLRPLVAASIGPYGAFLADGSEYTGEYGVDRAALDAFHRRRFHSLAASEADLVACETIPSCEEAQVLLDALAGAADTWAWLSFSCRDGVHISDGTPIAEAARLCEDGDRVAAIGINCTAPQYLAQLIDIVRAETTLPILAYPNSGEVYDARSKRWMSSGADHDLVGLAPTWVEKGAEGVGGCCRVGPETIARLRARLLVSYE